MTTDERNFRSAYYEKVGCRSVEEKKSFEILLKDKPLNRIKLKQFCLRFTVPAIHRELLWSLLLGVTPLFTDSREYVMTQRTAVYDDLLKVLRTLRIIDDKTQKSKVFYAMWLLENKSLQVGYNLNVENNFVSVTEILLQIFENEVEIYWIAKGFYEVSLDIRNDFDKLRELTCWLLIKEDKALFTYLEENKILSNLPLEKWYSSCFAGIIHKRALVKIWDKICCGSKKILIFVFLVLINTLWRRMLKKHKDIKGIMEGIHNIKDDQEIADQIANKAIELWELNKEQL